MSTPTLNALTQRLDRVERENRRMKLAGAVVLVVLAALAVLGLVLVLGAEGTAREAADEFGGQRFVVERDLLARMIQGGFDETAGSLQALRQEILRGLETVAKDLDVIRADIWQIRADLREIEMIQPDFTQASVETEFESAP
ncbi:MAG: hypothetical protein ACE5JN_16265 [Candidatus Methylomirabilia bacterium]